MKEQAVALAGSVFGGASRGITARPVGPTFFQSWTIWRVQDDDVVPPPVTFVATRPDQVQQVESADGFRALTSKEPVQLASASEAIAYVRFFLSVTEIMTDVLTPGTDIPWISEEARRQWSGQIAAPQAEQQGTDYAVALWLLSSGDLLRAHFSVDARGTITSSRELAAPGAAISVPLL